MKSPAPKRRPAAVLTAVVIAAGLIALGVLAVRELGVREGWWQGQSWAAGLLDAVDGLTPSDPLTGVAVLVLLVGLVLILTAARPARRTHILVADSEQLWLTPRSIGGIATRVADRTEGVVAADLTSATSRRISITVTTDGSVDRVTTSVQDNISSAFDGLDIPRIRLKTKALIS